MPVGAGVEVVVVGQFTVGSGKKSGNSAEQFPYESQSFGNGKVGNKQESDVKSEFQLKPSMGSII